MVSIDESESMELVELMESERDLIRRADIDIIEVWFAANNQSV